MDYDIVFLHTADVHIKMFAEIADQLDCNKRIHHIVDASLLLDAQQQGITDELKVRINNAMEAASLSANVVVCTCSTIGSEAEKSGDKKGFISMRIDRAMADKSVQIGSNILIVAAVQSTLQPTRELLQDSANRLKKSPIIDVLLVEDAWIYFEEGETEKYIQTLAERIHQNYSSYDVVVLAQASMAKTADLCSNIDIPVLSSPNLGVISAFSVIKNELK